LILYINIIKFKLKGFDKHYLVVDVWAMIFPPIGFFVSPPNILAAPSTLATT